MKATRIGETVAYHGDCISTMDTLIALGTRVDSIVTDPPYHLSTVKRFCKEGAAPAKHGTDGLYQRASRGFMGKEWDGGDIAFNPETWRRCYDLLKPGGYLLAFSGSRTYHRMACAIEDAGFEIRDQIMWLYGQGFPKSHDVSKAIDKAAGVEGSYGAPKSAAHAGWIECGRMRGDQNEEGWQRPWMNDPAQVDKNARLYEPATDAAREWQGWGSNLKPAHEPIVMARKPLDGTVAANVLAHGTGAINIDACRVGTDTVGWGGKAAGGDTWNESNMGLGKNGEPRPVVGRFPANVLHDGSLTETWARYFYCAKASKRDRAGSKHPTVKPVSLIEYLCKLVTRPGGTVLDPFAGSGTLGSAWPRSILIEREAEYYEDICRRLTSEQ